MSSALRLSIIMVLLLATTAFGLIAYNMNLSKQAPAPAPVAVAEKAPAAPATVGYFVAARPLPKGTFARDEDFKVRSASPGSVPAGAILETPDSRIGLPGSLVRKFVDVGSPITLQDILRPRDRGFLASVLAPDTRAISIKVDEESGVSGLIRPGDYVDIVLTQVFDKKDPSPRALSDTVLRNVRIVAIDQEIQEGGRPISAVAGKLAQTQTVSLELTPEQVKKITVAKQLGTLSLAVRAAVEQWDTADTGPSDCGLSPEIPLQSAAVVFYSGGAVKQYSVKKEGSEGSIVRCDGAVKVARQAATTVGIGNLPEKR